jgi:glycosyltransferase involved in cell wall biosynthesis
MRLSPHWAARFDGVHLLAPTYLAEARQAVPSAADRFFAVPHFADPERFRPATPDEKQQARLDFQLPPDDFLILTVGPIGTVSGKRLDALAQEVAALGPGTRLVSAGGDEDGADRVRTAVRAALGDRVLFLGPVPRDRMPMLYRAADVYSLGSLAEPFSIAILEALASGLPVVHHHEPTMTWQTGAGGLPVAMDTPGEAAEVFRQLRDDAARRDRIAQSARTLALNRYTPTAVAQQLVQQLERIHHGN